MRKALLLVLIPLFFAACSNNVTESGDSKMTELQALNAKYAPVEVSAKLEGLNENEQLLLSKLIEAARAIDVIYWKQASKDGLKVRSELAASTDEADKLKLRFLNINKFGFDRLDGNKPFLGEAPLPKGATFYPEDLTVSELEQYVADHPEAKEALYGLCTVVQRDGAELKAVPYSELYKEELTKAATLLREAAALAEEETLKTYLELRADALVSDNYFESDMAWMDLKGKFDIVIGAIEVYEDGLMGLKAAYESYVLVKDQAASDELESYIGSMEEMQQNLPVDAKFKQRQVQLGSSVGVFTQVFTAGQCEGGSKTIAISLPNDPKVREAKGARKVMLKNAIDAKFTKILRPIADRMMAEEQKDLVDINFFFSNTLLHEISHSLGNDYILDAEGNATEIQIEEKLKDFGTSIEECKADIGGLYAADVMVKKGLMEDADLEKAYATYTAGIFRSVRFGAASAHGKANALTINWLLEKEGVSVNEEGKYMVNKDKFHAAIEELLSTVLTIQHTGDYEGAKALFDKYGKLPADITSKLEAMTDIPVDIEFIWS